MLYALVINLCLINGQCNETAPETYTTLTECQIEVHHQYAQGWPEESVYCVAYKE